MLSKKSRSVPEVFIAGHGDTTDTGNRARKTSGTQDIINLDFFNNWSAKSTAAYWKILSDATDPKRRPQIGPLK